MPRYLTPARLCLVVLLKLYQSSHCSSESSLDLLDFIARHTVTAADHDIEAIRQRNTLLSTNVTGLATILQSWTSQFPGRNMYDLLLHSIWELNGLDSLHELLTKMKYLTVPGGDATSDDTGLRMRPITAASPLGQFVRRCYVEFTRLQFADSQALWKALAAWRAPTWDEWSQKNPDAANILQLEETSNFKGVTFSSSTQGNVSEETPTASTVDADVLLGYAIHQLQKMGTRVPEDVKAQLQQWVGDQWDSGTQSLHFFMAFFEHWRAGQYTMALESLHRYFDYSLGARSGSDNMRVYYQYALLHLSVLHADFECWEESVDAMNECIATARENQDTACLNFALSWLLYLRHAHPGKGVKYNSISGVVGSSGGDNDEVAFLKQKAREGKHWMLLTSTLLEEGRIELFSGGSANRAQEHVLQAMYLTVQHDLRTLAPAGLLFHGACLDRLGQSHLATRMYELPGTVHAAHCPTNDRIRSACRLALTMSQRGHYVQALTILREHTPVVRGVLKSEQRLQAFEALIHLRRQIHHGDHDAAGYYLSQLRPIRSFTDPEIAFEFDTLEIESLLKRQAYHEALQKVHARLSERQGRGSDLAQRLHFLLLKSRIFAAGGQAAKGFSIAIRATSTAERHLLVPVLLEGLATLSHILNELSEFEMARQILESSIPHALEANNTFLVARMLVTVGEACVGYAGYKCGANLSEQTKSMRTAMEYVERGRVAYEHTEDVAGQLECLLMKGKIAEWCEDEATVQKADEMYMQLLAKSEQKG